MKSATTRRIAAAPNTRRTAAATSARRERPTKPKAKPKAAPADPDKPKARAAKPTRVARSATIYTYPPIEAMSKPVLSTREAAHYLNRKEQTLREWACHQSGPIKPLRIFGKLAWKTNQVKVLVGLS